MGVQYCTSSVCPLLVLISLLFTGHGLIRCLEKVVKLQKYCRKRWNLSKWISDKFYNRCQIIDNQGWRAWKRISIAAPINMAPPQISLGGGKSPKEFICLLYLR